MFIEDENLLEDEDRDFYESSGQHLISGTNNHEALALLQ